MPANNTGRPRNSLKAILRELLAAKHPPGLGRWLYAYLTHSDLPLAASMQPAPRPAGARITRPQRSKPLVLMVTTNLNADGAPLSQFELATGLGPDLDIRIFAKADGPLRQRYQQHGIPVSIVPQLACNTSVPAWYEDDVRDLADILLQDPPDLVMASTIDAFPAVDAARIAGAPSIWNIRESESWRVRLANLHPLVAARAAACFSYPEVIVFVARASQTAWQAFAPRERSHVIYNAPHPSLLSAPVSEDLPRSLATPEGTTLIACVGTLCERKGQIDLARALSALPTGTLSRVKAAFVGRDEGGYQARIERALAPAAATASTFPGPVANGAGVIAAAGVLVHTARSEAFPRVLLEAAALGTPIIATAVDGAPERLKHGESALFYAPGDIPALKSAIERLLNEPGLREKLTAGAKDTLVTSHSFADMLDAYRRHIDAALAARPAAVDLQ